ncbi:P-type DNA transfer ATPase VirB11 [Halomonas sp. 3D7M]|uniref:P-type DNA transfer ATPase VirB11 n=1 Tax=Halomonas sp. 3D7M TaxID=2742617 RepID=UPI0018682CB7|nr:P-type DNA transfer ATPase VirB11 [Halomonas sp. 3D7M]
MIDRTVTSRNLLRKMGITELLETPGITEVAINKPGEIWSEVKGCWERHYNNNVTQDSFLQLANSLAILNNNEVSRENPICSVTLPSGERGWIIAPPACASFNCSITIRKPSTCRFTLQDYRTTGRFDNAFVASAEASYLEPYQVAIKDAINAGDIETMCRLAVDHKLNVVCGGGTGSGKTTFMKTLADLYPASRRYITIEDSLELDLPEHPNHVRLLYRDGTKITPKKLIESCMRMKPDHVFLTEIKGDEAWGYLELLNTGHRGSITSAHFNDAKSCHARLADLVKQSPIGMTLDYSFILETVRKTIDLVLFWRGTYLEGIYYNPEGQKKLLMGEAYDG